METLELLYHTWYCTMHAIDGTVKVTPWVGLRNILRSKVCWKISSNLRTIGLSIDPSAAVHTRLLQCLQNDDAAFVNFFLIFFYNFGFRFSYIITINNNNYKLSVAFATTMEYRTLYIKYISAPWADDCTVTRLLQLILELVRNQPISFRSQIIIYHAAFVNTSANISRTSASCYKSSALVTTCNCYTRPLRLDSTIYFISLGCRQI